MDGCIEWAGTRTAKGYGQVTRDGQRMYAHRAAWIDAHGPIPDGLCVLHSCDNPPCVAVEHLHLGTYQDNAREMVERGRHFQTRKQACPQGHPYEHVDSGGGRRCRECKRQESRTARARKRERTA